jgi:DNA-binding NarL/FixJ family response regulator
MDITMPEMDDLEATEIIVNDFPDIPVIIFSSCHCEDWKIEALKAGAAAYLVKGAPLSEIKLALRNVLGGKLPFR